MQTEGEPHEASRAAWGQSTLGTNQRMNRRGEMVEKAPPLGQQVARALQPVSLLGDWDYDPALDPACL